VSDPRDNYIAQVVNGKSFADVGGLWGTINEKCSVAHQHGAAQLAMIDLVDSKDELWKAFDDRRRSLSVPDVRCIPGDVIELARSPERPTFDVVHCSGVLYHIPAPMQLLTALRKMTREYLILSSSITATTVRSARGVLQVPAGSALFVPALKGEEREIVKEHWAKTVSNNAYGLTREIPVWDPADMSPWWWLPTVECLKAMCEAAGFTVRDGSLYWHDNAYTLLLATRR
jgi:Methyltransferase domain